MPTHKPEHPPRPVAVLGAGAWGTALAIAASRHVPTMLWARDAVLAEQAEYLAKLDAAGVIVESDYRFDATPKVTADSTDTTGDNDAGN